MRPPGEAPKNTLSIGTRLCGEATSKVMRGYTQSGQYHTIVMESRVRNRENDNKVLINEMLMEISWVNNVRK